MLTSLQVESLYTAGNIYGSFLGSRNMCQVLNSAHRPLMRCHVKVTMCSLSVDVIHAGIMDFNIVPYTSVMPKEATELQFLQAKPLFRHGAVLESIIAQMNGSQGDRISAGVGLAQVRKKCDTHSMFGMYVYSVYVILLTISVAVILPLRMSGADSKEVGW